MGGWVGGWMDGWESRVKDCLQQSKTTKWVQKWGGGFKQTKMYQNYLRWQFWPWGFKKSSTEILISLIFVSLPIRQGPVSRPRPRKMLWRNVNFSLIGPVEMRFTMLFHLNL